MLITSKTAVLTSVCSRMINNAATTPMTKNKSPFTLIQTALVKSFIIQFAAALCLTGCASTAHKLGSHRLAAVIIKGSSPDAIKASAKDVFDKHDFEAEPEDDNDLVFQKKASGMNSFVYGDWFSGPVTARVKLYLGETKAGEILLDGDVYMVQEADDPLFTKERRVHARRGELQKLLDEIKVEAEKRK